MRPVIVTVEINCPAAEVYAFLEAVENNTKWLRGMDSCTWTTAPPVHAGSRYEQHAHFLGKEIRTVFEVIALEPGHLVTIQSRQGSSFPLTVTRQVDAIDDTRCRVTETVESEPAGFYRVAGPMLHAMVRRNIKRDYKRLRDLLETGSGRDPEVLSAG